jgi:uncharacterized tellurite resistance protein B-like protein
MNPQPDARLLVKILIGVAWLDGKIQAEERQYLDRVLHTHHLNDDADLNSLLTGTSAVTPTQCQEWIQEYLGDRSIHDDDRLIEEISKMIYSDGDVATAEAKLLNDLQSTPTSAQPSTGAVANKLRQLYRGWVDRLHS